MTLTIADLLTIVGAVLGPLLLIGGGALAWLRADMARMDDRLRAEIARLDERQRADTAAINMRLDTLTQTIITSTIARSSQAHPSAEPASQSVPVSSTPQA